jgi:hypothetical protein
VTPWCTTPKAARKRITRIRLATPMAVVADRVTSGIAAGPEIPASIRRWAPANVM